MVYAIDGNDPGVENKFVNGTWKNLYMLLGQPVDTISVIVFKCFFIIIRYIVLFYSFMSDKCNALSSSLQFF